MVNWVPIVAATIAAIPSAAIFFVAYGRYDGAFRDNVVFLYFIGGLVLGGFLGFLTLLLTNTGALIQIVGAALLYPIAMVATINRRKWQGDRHAIFNGGAAGLGAAVMLSFSIVYFYTNVPLQAAIDAAKAAAQANNTTAVPVNTIPYAFQPYAIFQGVLLACAIAGLLFGMGLLAGDGVRRRRQFRVAFMGTAILLAPIILFVSWLNQPFVIYPLLLLALGAVFGIVAERRILPLALEDDTRRQRRRALRSDRDA